MRRLLRDERGFSLIELMVVITILSVVSGAITRVVISGYRSETFQREMRVVMDDGRITIGRIRKELRQARRVLPDSCRVAGATTEADCEPSQRLHYWVDRDRDDVMDADELVCWAVESLAPRPGFRIARWLEPDPTADCATVPTNATTLAQTLVPNPDDPTATEPWPFADIDPVPQADPNVEEQTDRVTVRLHLEVVRTDRGPRAMTFETTVRLRNVE